MSQYGREHQLHGGGVSNREKKNRHPEGVQRAIAGGGIRALRQGRL